MEEAKALALAQKQQIDLILESMLKLSIEQGYSLQNPEDETEDTSPVW
jgi:hypothetical protein